MNNEQKNERIVELLKEIDTQPVLGKIINNQLETNRSKEAIEFLRKLIKADPKVLNDYLGDELFNLLNS